jgi:hypothetical protein
MITPEQEDSITLAARIAALAFNAHPDCRSRSYRTFTNLLPAAPALVKMCSLPSRDYATFAVNDSTKTVDGL